MKEVNGVRITGKASKTGDKGTYLDKHIPYFTPDSSLPPKTITRYIPLWQYEYIFGYTGVVLIYTLVETRCEILWPLWSFL